MTSTTDKNQLDTTVDNTTSFSENRITDPNSHNAINDPLETTAAAAAATAVATAAPAPTESNVPLPLLKSPLSTIPTQTDPPDNAASDSPSDPTNPTNPTDTDATDPSPSTLKPPPTPEEPPPMSPRSKKRFEKAEKRRIAKEKRDADRAKTKADRAKAKEAMKGLSGEERDAARQQMKADAEKKRKEQAMDRKADLAMQQAMEGPDDGKPVKLSKEVLAHLAKKKQEEEIAAAKKKLFDEEKRLREEEEAKITCAHQENDRYSSRVRIQISKSGTQWGSWHSRYASLGYRELRIYNRYENRKPQHVYRIPSGSVCRYIPNLKINGGILENPDKVGGMLTVDVIGASGLRNADGLFGKSDPYCEIFFNDKLITKTKTIDDTLAPEWKHNDTIEINPVELNNGKWKHSELVAIVWDEDDDGKPDFLGQVVYSKDDLIKLLHNPMPTTSPLLNRPNAKIGLLGDERKAKGSLTIQLSLKSNETVDRPRVLEFGLKDINQRDDKKIKKVKKKKDGNAKGGVVKATKKKRKRKGKRNYETGEWIPDVVPLTGVDRRGIGTTPARHNGSESIPKTAKDRKKQRDAIPSKTRIRLQLPSIKVARKWIYVLIEYFPNVVTYLHTTRKKKPEDEDNEDNEDDEMESVFTEVTMLEEEVKEEEAKEEKATEEKATEEKATEEKATEEKATEEKATEEKATELNATELNAKEPHAKESNAKEGGNSLTEKDGTQEGESKEAIMKTKETENEKANRSNIEQEATIAPPSSSSQKSSQKPKRTKRVKVHRLKKKKTIKPINKAQIWEQDMKTFFTEIACADGIGVTFNLKSLMHMVVGTYHVGRMDHQKLPLLTEKSLNTMRQWKILNLMLQPKYYHKGFELFHQKKMKLDNNGKTFQHTNVNWEELAIISGLASKASKYQMQHRDSTRKEMISAAEVKRQENRKMAAACRERREIREKIESEKIKKRKQQEKRQALRTKMVLDREKEGQAAREEEMGVPHEHLCISINGNPYHYCPVCRQLAWQKANGKWRRDEETKREVYNKQIIALREAEEKTKKQNKTNIRLATSTPKIKKELKHNEKKRRQVFLKQDELLVNTEASRRQEWNNADEKHRTKERYLRPLESKALRTHTQHRGTWLQAVTLFRDRTLIARLLWQRLLDKKATFSSGNMRHLIWDESYEEFRVAQFIACKSKPSAELIQERAQLLKSMAVHCHDLVRVRDCWYQPGEGAAGYGFVSLVLLDYVGSAKTVNTIETYMKGTTKLSEMTALKWGRSVANGLKYMHNKHIIHGNIKASNVFLNSANEAKLGDYPFFKSTSPQPLMKKLNKSTDILEFGLLLYYICTGGAIIPMNEYEECNMLESTMVRLIPVRFGTVLKEVLRMSLYHCNAEEGEEAYDDDGEEEEEDNENKANRRVTMTAIVNMLHRRIRDIELVTELHNARVLLLDNALNVIDDSSEGFYNKQDVCQALITNSTVRAILSQDVELALLIGTPKKSGTFIMKMATKRGDAGQSEFLESDDLLNLVKQMMITKQRDDDEKQRIQDEEERIRVAEEELSKKNKKR